MLLCFCLFLSDPKIFLLDGSTYDPVQVVFEKGMLNCRLENGTSISVGRSLVDWRRSGPTIPEIYLELYPKEAPQVISDAKAQRKKRETLGGLAKRWDGQSAETGDSSAPAKAVSGPDIKTISGGGPLDLGSQKIQGKYVIFDFYADWCGPCRQLTPRLEAYVSQNPAQFALRKVDIINWQTEVVKQFKIRGIPYLIVIDERGKQVKAGSGFQVFNSLDSLKK